MKINRISAWQIDLPIREGSFIWSGGMLDAFDSTIVRVDTDEGVSGWGEVCPLGPAYLPSYAEGVRTGIAHLAPLLIDTNAVELASLNIRMDKALKGHPYAKSAIDMACWDILGKVSGLPVFTLLGGRMSDSVPLYRAISQDSADAMADRVSEYLSEGYRRFQLKLGGRPDDDIERILAVANVLGPGETLIADANTGWLMHEAARVVRAVAQVDVYIEQPCRGWAECLSIRRRTGLPFILDESIDDLDSLLRGHADSAMDIVNLKISKFGGLTRALQARDLCVGIGVAVIIEDTCGGDVVTSAVAHLAQSTPDSHLFSATDLNGYVTRTFADGALVRENGMIATSHAPGLGVEPRLEELGSPIISVG